MSGHTDLTITLDDLVKVLEKKVEAIVDEQIKEYDNVVNRKIIRANYKTAKRLAETGDANLVAEEHKELLDIYFDELDCDEQKSHVNN